MIKVFLVDDEIIIREGIRSSFPWEESGYSLVGEAPDGEIALPMIRDANPDILITDIRMPFMDGMALCREMKRQMPWVGVIIISGYDDFAYAREAISLGVQEYMLKPIAIKELKEVLDRISARIREKRRELEDLDLRRKRLASSNSFLKEQLLSSLFSEETDERTSDNTLRQMHQLGINLAASCYAVADISFPDEHHALGREVIASLAENNGAVHVYPIRCGARALVLGDSEVDTEERAYAFASSVVRELEHIGCAQMRVTIGDIVDSFADVRRAMQSARHTRHIAESSAELTMRIVGVRELSDMPALGLIAQSPGSRPRSAASRGNSSIDKACAYLAANFNNPNLMLQDVAREVCMSSSRLSTVFAQETGFTFTEYLTALRITKAKDLLRSSDLRSSQIAFAAGYNDSHYFSYMFKKNTGLTPSEYRRQSRE